MSYNLKGYDIAAISAYIVILIGVYIYSLSRSNRFNTEGYFLAGRNMNWFLVGMSLFSTNIGAEHFLGLSSSGVTNGISAAAFEIHAIVVMQLLSWVFVPTLISAGVLTMPEYFSSRLGGQRIRTVLAMVYLLLYILTKVSVNIYAGALFINVAFNLNLYIAIIAVLCLAALFTVGGGLATVMYTDTCMSTLMLLGGTILCVISFKNVGYMPGLYSAYMNAVTNLTIQLNKTDPTNPLIDCGLPKINAFQMIRGIRDSYMPWLGFFLGHTPNTIWYWCSDQMMVQRVMAAKSASHARAATLLTGILKISPLFLMVFVGMISRSLFVEEVGGIGSNFTNRAYPVIVMELLPVGLKGLHLAVMISALVSGLTSLFNSSSTLFTLDIYRLIRKKASNLELMIVGRTFAILIILLAISWIPVVIKMEGTDIYIYIQSVNSFFAAPICCIFLLTVFWKGLSEPAAFWALLSGFSMGILRMILEFSKPAPKCGQPNNSFKIVSKVNFMYFSAINFFVTGCLAILISLFTEKPSFDRNIKGKTFQTRRTKDKICKTDVESNIIDGNENTLNLDKISHNANETVDHETISNAINENKTFFQWSKYLLKFICGMNVKGKKDKTDSSRTDYDSIIDKFNENNIPKYTRLLLRTMLTFLIIGVSTCYIVLSLNPSITFY